MKTFTLLIMVLLMSTGVSYAGEYLAVAAVGDIMMGTDHPEDLLPPNDGEGIFNGVSRELRGHDLVVGNIEGPIIDGGKPAKCGRPGKNCYEFRTPVRFTGRLKEAGFNVLSIANNHSFDFGLEGVRSTIRSLGSAGIRAVGGRETPVMEIKGRRVAVAGFSSSPSAYSYSLLDIQAATDIVRRLKGTCDILIVTFHGGAEGHGAQHVTGGEEFYLGEERGNVVGFSRAVIDAGADMVIGHGPHVLRALELYRGKLIAYSLGNFLGYKRFNISGPSGLSVILKARIDIATNAFLGGELVPVRILGHGLPEVDPSGRATRLLIKLTREDIPSPNIIITDGGRLHPDEDVALESTRSEE